MGKKAGAVIFLAFAIFLYFPVKAASGQNYRQLADSVFQTLSLKDKVRQLIFVNLSNDQSLPLPDSDTLRNSSFGGYLLSAHQRFQWPSNHIEDTLSYIPLLAYNTPQLGFGDQKGFLYPSYDVLSQVDDTSLLHELWNEGIAQHTFLGADIMFPPLYELSLQEGELYTRAIKEVSNGFDLTSEISKSVRIKWSEDYVKHGKEIVQWLQLATSDWNGIPVVQFDGLFAGENASNSRIQKRLFEKYLNTIADDYLYLSNSTEASVQEQLLALKEGCHMVATEQPALLESAIMQSLQSGEWNEVEFERSVKQVLYAKSRMHNSTHRTIQTKYERFYANSALIEDVYLKSIEHEGECDQEDIPFKRLSEQTFATFIMDYSRHQALTETMNDYAKSPTFYYDHFNPNIFDAVQLIEQLDAFDHIVVGIFYPLNQKEIEILRHLTSVTHLILLDFNSNDDSKYMVQADHYYHCSDDNYVSEALLPQVLFGAKGIEHPLRLSLDVPEKAGIDGNYLHLIDTIAQYGIDQKAYPGCQVLVARQGKVVFNQSYGYFTYDSIKQVTNSDLYDLASVTKVAATTQTIMFLADQGVIDINARIGQYLPELKGTDKDSLLIRDILAHQSGLRPGFPFWKYTVDNQATEQLFYSELPKSEYDYMVAQGMYANKQLSDSLWQWTIDLPLRRKRKWQEDKPYGYKYSDLGFMMMYKLAERMLNQPMDEFLSQNLYEPLGMIHTLYNPLCQFSQADIVPTEYDIYFRDELVWGTVHDPMAGMMGGVAGHAGLFSNALDLAKLGQLMLQGGHYGGYQFYHQDVVKDFSTKHFEKNRRGYGWDKVTEDTHIRSASKYASQESFGHTGFTGTMIWIDPKYDLIFVFLSNRIHPSSTNKKLMELDVRKKIHDIVYEAMQKYDQSELSLRN